jgi:hypothetical protein
MIITNQVIEEINEVWKIALSITITEYKDLFKNAVRNGTGFKNSHIYREVTKYLIYSTHLYDFEFRAEQIQGGVHLRLVSKSNPSIRFVYCRLLNETMFFTGDEKSSPMPVCLQKMFIRFRSTALRDEAYLLRYNPTPMLGSVSSEQIREEEGNLADYVEITLKSMFSTIYGKYIIRMQNGPET